MIDQPVLALYLHIVRVAGLAGRPMPGLTLRDGRITDRLGVRLDSEQMHQVNGVYEQSRAEHRQRTMRGRAR